MTRETKIAVSALNHSRHVPRRPGSAPSLSRFAAMVLAAAGIASCGGGEAHHQQSLPKHAVPPGGGQYITLSLVNLRTHRADITVIASSKSVTSEASGEVRALPCSHSRYLVKAIGGTLARPVGSPYEAHLAMGRATLPRGIICGDALPDSLVGRLTISVIEGKEPRFRISGTRGQHGSLSGMLYEEVTTSLCDGRFVFRATLRVHDHKMLFVYPFTLTDVTGVPSPCKA
jgi:hypothetical protein